MKFTSHENAIPTQCYNMLYSNIINNIGRGVRTFSDYATNGAGLRDIMVGLAMQNDDIDLNDPDIINKFAVHTPKLMSLSKDKIEQFKSWIKGEILPTYQNFEMKGIVKFGVFGLALDLLVDESFVVTFEYTAY